MSLLFGVLAGCRLGGDFVVVGVWCFLGVAGFRSFCGLAQYRFCFVGGVGGGVLGALVSFRFGVIVLFVGWCRFVDFGVWGAFGCLV